METQTFSGFTNAGQSIPIEEEYETVKTRIERTVKSLDENRVGIHYRSRHRERAVFRLSFHQRANWRLLFGLRALIIPNSLMAS